VNLIRHIYYIEHRKQIALRIAFDNIKYMLSRKSEQMNKIFGTLSPLDFW